MLENLVKKIRIFFLVASVLATPILFKNAFPQPPSPLQIYFFHAKDCQPCQAILEGYLPTLKPIYPFLEIKTFDIGNPVYYETLSRIENQFGRKESKLPVVIIGNHLLAGEMEVMEKLNPLILEYQAMGESSTPSIEIPSLTPPPPSVASAVSVDLTYFHQKGCPKCDRANALLEYLSKKYPNLKVKEVDINTPDGKRLNETLSNRLQLPPERRLIAPSIFIGNDYLSPDEVTASRMEELIKKYSEGTSVGDSKIIQPSPSPTPEELKKAETSMIERFKSFGLLAILIAGLIEGLNPCALATLVFFISYLTMIGRKRNEIFLVGLGFSTTAFVTHFLLGIGIFSVIQHLSFFSLFSRIVYWVTFLFSLFLGILSFYDYIQLKKGHPSRMKLQIPDFLKKKIHRIIRSSSGEEEENSEGHAMRFLLAAVFIGFIVTLLQSTCTSQVYLPTLLFVTQVPSLRGNAMLYLVFYNLVYILPLLFIFGIVYWGVTSQQLALLLQGKAPSIKILTSLFFFALAGILIFALI